MTLKERRFKLCVWCMVLVLLIVFVFFIRVFPQNNKVFEELVTSSSNNVIVIEKEKIPTNKEENAIQKNEFKSNVKMQKDNEDVIDYDYSMPISESQPVDDSFFDDAIFVGNSRTEGFMLHSGLTNAKSYTAIGISVETIFTRPVVYIVDERVPIMDAIKNEEFSKVYIMLGMNELGWKYTSVFCEYYAQVIDTIREINPDVDIYVESIIPVSREKSDSDKVYNNAKIEEFNKVIKKLTEDKKVYFVNVSEALIDEDGYLPEEATQDGIHLTPEYCKPWLAYLKTHTKEGLIK